MNAVESDLPTVDAVLALDAASAGMVAHQWMKASLTNGWLAGRETLSRIEGGVDALFAPPELSALDDAVAANESISQENRYAVESSSRWAFLASEHRSILSEWEYEALVRAWRMRHAGAEFRAAEHHSTQEEKMTEDTSVKAYTLYVILGSGKESKVSTYTLDGARKAAQIMFDGGLASKCIIRRKSGHTDVPDFEETLIHE